MDFDIASVKITGNPGQGGWAQIHDFKPEDINKLDLRGRLFAVIATNENGSGMDNITSGREIISRIHEEYYGDLNTSSFYALRDAVEKVIQEFGSGLNNNIEIVAAAFVKGVLYVACGGETQAAVYRNGMLAKILVSNSKEVVCASGYPLAGDMFLLGTSSFYKGFAEGTIKANLENVALEKINESFAGTIHSLQNSGSIGLVIISFNEVKIPLVELNYENPNEQTKPASFRKPNISNLFRKIIDKFPRKIYIRHGEIDEKSEKNKKTILTSGIILIILLFISIGFGIKQKGLKEYKNTYADKLLQAQHNFDESQNLLSLNPQRARELFLESRSVVDDLISKEIKDPILDELERKIKDTEGSILGEYKVVPDLYLDLTLLSSGFKGDNVASTLESIVILDKQGRKIVKIDIESKKSNVVAGPEQIRDPLDLAIYSDRIILLEKSGIFEVDDEIEKLLDKDWSDNSTIYAYAGNIYMIDIDANDIYRFNAIGNSFTKKQNWLGNEKGDFSLFSSWTIDGSIWMATKNGQIKKFTQGVEHSFNLNNVTPSVVKIEAIYSNEEQEYLYILARELGRIIVVDKNGEFKSQYADELLKSARKLIVSEKEKIMIFLTDDSKLYSIEIKHK